MHMRLAAEPSLNCEVSNAPQARGDMAALATEDLKPVSRGREFRAALDGVRVCAIGKIQRRLSVADEVVVARGKPGRPLGFSPAIEMNARGSRLARAMIY